MPATFLTGTTGFIGSEILRRLLQGGSERRVYALVRAPDAAEAARRGRQVLFKLFMDDLEATADAKRRVRWVTGELARPGLGLAPEDRAEVVAECDEIIHSAASTDWDLSFDEAEAVNFVGVLRITELAAAMARGGRLARFVHISTAYVAGRRDGAVAPEDLPGAEGPFNNTYEATKAKAERFLREQMEEVPITVVRPSIVVGDSRSGRTFNFNVIYFPLKLMYHGLLPVVPGRATTTLDIVPVDYVCDATIALGRDPSAVGRTYHLTADDDALPLVAFADRITRFINERMRAGRPPVRSPRLIGPMAWWGIRWWYGRKLRGKAKRQFDAFNTYLPYILTDKRFVATSTRQALDGRVPYPPVASYILRVAEYAITREWGKDVSWAPSLMRDDL